MRHATSLTWCCLLFALHGDRAALAEPSWTSNGTKDGVAYEQREVPGSSYLEHRASFEIPVTPEVALAGIWEVVSAGKTANHEKREFLRRTDREVLVHDEVTHPIVSDREVTLLIRKTTQPLGVTFESRNDLGPPPSPKRVLLPRVYGSWTIQPTATGSRVSFLCYSEPGGTIAAFLVRPAQAKQIAKDVTRVRRQLGF